MQNSPDIKESDWVPLANTFSQNLSKRDGQDDREFTFTVARGSADAQVAISFSGVSSLEEGGGEPCELSEEMSFDKLLTLHRQMVELYPDEVEDDLLPTLPSVPTGLWSYLLSVDVHPTFYKEVEEYLNTLASRCSVDNVLVVLFADVFLSAENYEDQWSDLNRRKYQEELECYQREWKELLEKKTKTEFTSMATLHAHYDEEDALEYHLEKAEEKLHSFHTGPFQDLCEIARKRRDEASSRAKDVELSLPEQMKALHEEREHHEQYLEASESLHELAIEYSHTLASRVEGRLTSMREDGEWLLKAGSRFDSRARQRMDRIENKLNKTIVEMLRLQCKRLADQKDRAMLDMAIVEEGPDMETKVREKEDSVFKIQFRLLEIQLRLLEEEERKLKLQEKYAEGDTLEGLQRRLDYLPSKMSKLRLRMLTCKEHLDHPDKRTINVQESYSAQFAAQKKAAVTKKEEEKRKLLMKEQRQKTIQRVKVYMEKNPVPVKKLPPRYRPQPLRTASNRKRADKKTTPTATPTASRTGSLAVLTKSAYNSGARKPSKSGDKKSATKSEKTGSKKKSGQPTSTGGKKSEPQNPPHGDDPPNERVPPVPPLPQDMQAIVEATKNLPPAPPVPPPPTPPPPPPSTIQIPPPPSAGANSATSSKKTTSKNLQASKKDGKVDKKRTAKSPLNSSSSSSGINLNAILNARQKLKPSAFGQALGTGDMSSTSDEVACLIRSGAKADGANSSLTKDAASFLRKRFEHIKAVTGQSDSESSDSEEDWDQF